MAPARLVLALRVSPEDMARVETLARRIPGTTRGSIGREALVRGLAALEAEYGGSAGRGPRRKAPKSARTRGGDRG